MEIELRLEPEREGILLTVHAPARTPEVEALLARLGSGDEKTLLGFQGGRVEMLEIAGILRFYGEEKEVRAQTGKGVFTVRRRLYELEEWLARYEFARISHSEIVNLRQVAALDLRLTGTIQLTLKDGTACYVSRRYVKKIKEVLGL